MATKQRARRWRAAYPLLGNWEYKIRVKGTVIDIHGVDWVSVKVSGQSTKKAHLHGEKMGTFDKSYNVDWGRSIGGGYDIKVKAGDVNGNVAKYKTHMDGVLEAFVNLVMKLLTALLEAILALLTMFIDWICNAIRWMFNTVFKPITDALRTFAKDYGKSINNAWSEYENTNGFSSNSKNSINNVLQGSFYNLIRCILTVINAVGSLVNPFLSLVSGLLTQVGSFLVPIILGAIGLSKKNKDKSAFNSNMGINSISNFVNTNMNHDSSDSGIDLVQLSIVAGAISTFLSVIALFSDSSDVAIIAFCAAFLGGSLAWTFDVVGKKTTNEKALLFAKIITACLCIFGVVMGVASYFMSDSFTDYIFGTIGIVFGIGGAVILGLDW